MNKKCHQYCTNLDTKKIISICPETEFSQCIDRAREGKDILQRNSKKNFKNSPNLKNILHVTFIQIKQGKHHPAVSFTSVMTGEDDFIDQGLEFYLYPYKLQMSRDLLL